MTLEQLADSVDFDAELVCDDFVKGDDLGNRINRYGQSHWKIHISRNGFSFETEYHMGAAYRVWSKSINEPGQVNCRKGDRVVMPRRISLFLEGLLVKHTVPEMPEVLDVLHCLVCDAQCADYGSFPEFCNHLGYDEDSRAAEKIFDACRTTFFALRRMFDFQQLQQLNELLLEY